MAEQTSRKMKSLESDVQRLEGQVERLARAVLYLSDKLVGALGSGPLTASEAAYVEHIVRGDMGILLNGDDKIIAKRP